MDDNLWNDTYPSGGNYWSDFDEPGDGASSTADTDEHLTLELPEWALRLDTKFQLELSHNA